MSRSSSFYMFGKAGGMKVDLRKEGYMPIPMPEPSLYSWSPISYVRCEHYHMVGIGLVGGNFELVLLTPRLLSGPAACGRHCFLPAFSPMSLDCGPAWRFAACRDLSGRADFLEKLGMLGPLAVPYFTMCIPFLIPGAHAARRGLAAWRKRELTNPCRGHCHRRDLRCP